MWNLVVSSAEFLLPLFAHALVPYHLPPFPLLDQDTADYLSTAVPDSWVTAYGSSLTSRLVAALEDTRLNHPTITLEERVARVCDMLQPHPPTT